MSNDEIISVSLSRYDWWSVLQWYEICINDRCSSDSEREAEEGVAEKIIKQLGEKDVR